MKYMKSLQQMISTGLILFFLTGCSNSAAIPPSSTPVPPSPTFTPNPTSTLTPTATASPTATPIPIPPLPTVQALPTYQNPLVQITDQKGVVTTVTIGGSGIGDLLLQIADGIYAEIPWYDLRRVYQSDGEFIVTLADGQELKGQPYSEQYDQTLRDENGTTWDMQSLSSIVVMGLDSFWLKSSSEPVKNTPPGHQWQLHVSEPKDLTFTVTSPEFAFEYIATTHSTVFGDTSEKAEGFTQSFTLELGGISHNLSSLQEFRRDNANQITIKSNGTETSGGFFPILNYMGHIYKGSTPNWYLRAVWVDHRLFIVLKNPTWTLTK